MAGQPIFELRILISKGGGGQVAEWFKSSLRFSTWSESVEGPK